MTSLPIFTRAENKSLYWLQMAQQSQMSDEYRRETERMIRQHEAGCTHEELAQNMCAFMCRFARQQVQSTGRALNELILRRDQPLSPQDRNAVIRKLAEWEKQHQAWTKEMYDIEVRTVSHTTWASRAEHHQAIEAAVHASIEVLTASYRDERASGRKTSRSTLTDKQLEALQIVGQHHGNFAAAARALNKDRKTVEEHYRTALKKLCVANQGAAKRQPPVLTPSFTHT